MQKYVLLVLVTVAVAMALQNCRKDWGAADEAYYARFTGKPDSSSVSYKSCLRIAIQEVIRIGLDTAQLVMYESREDSTTYLFRFMPKEQPRVEADGTLVAVMGWCPDIFVRKVDCKIEKRYIAK